jgi:hypothetical protein
VASLVANTRPVASTRARPFRRVDPATAGGTQTAGALDDGDRVRGAAIDLRGRDPGSFSIRRAAAPVSTNRSRAVAHVGRAHGLGALVQRAQDRDVSTEQQ